MMDKVCKKNLKMAALLTVLFVVDLFLIDPIPLIDEILLGFFSGKNILKVLDCFF